jgi:dolichol-phosphate mannosyltransferase
MLLASIIGDEISILWNFALNQRWTFRKSGNKDSILVRCLKFHLITITSVGINNAVLFLLNGLFGVWDLLAKLIGIFVAFLWNYIGSTRWAWKE